MGTMSAPPTGGSFGKVQTMATRTITRVKTVRRELLGGVSVTSIYREPSYVKSLILLTSRLHFFLPGLWGDQEEPDEEGNGTIVFVYLWTLVLIFALTVYGNRLMSAGNLEALRFALLGFANYAFICCVLLGGLDAVKTEGREIEETGWYGQTSVLLLLTCLFMLVSSIIFSFRLRSRIKAAREDVKQQSFLPHNSPQHSASESSANV